MNFDAVPRNWFQRQDLKPFAFNTRNNRLPNLWCFCNINLNPDILCIDDQSVSFCIFENGKKLAISAIYASTSNIRRKHLWENLKNLHTQYNLPWNCIGDFNTVLGAHEHLGNFSPARPPIQDFIDWTDNLNLIHLPTRGAFYTWNNGRRGRAHTQRRLDRSVCNQAWLDICHSTSCSSLLKTTSDHYPLLLMFDTTEVRYASNFKFLKMWALHNDCREFIATCWQSPVIGCPMFILTKKLKILKDKLKIWNKEVFGNVHDYVKQSELNLSLIQDQIHSDGPSDSLLNLEKNAQSDLHKALERQENFWQEKARTNWHMSGDRNTAYFHRLSKIKNKTKMISSLRDGENIITDPQDISNHIVSYYKNLFCSNPLLQDELLAEEVIPQMVGDNTNQMLTALPTHEEIKSAVFNLNKDGAPGPDGFGAFFFQTYWEIIHKELIDAVMQFFVSGWILPNYNANTLILIPKHVNADSVEQYRPIAMANFKFKVISKIIADRLASILPTIVSPNQKGFIKGRNIKDCLCLASEAINILDKKSFGGNLALKIDITKAFDTLDWRFLLKVLRCFGFNDTFCNWISSILSSATLSISVNGYLQGYFNCTRGVRQGDPLSPLLFCLAEEVLSRGISNLVHEGKVKLIAGARNIQIPSHCFYADDIMIYCRGNLDSLTSLKLLFTRYANSAGQIISARKSTIYAGGISQARLHNIVELLGFEIGSLPFNYLGVPIFKGRPKSIYLQPIADKIKSKLSAWKASLLSIAGRVQLVKSVLFSMLNHSMSIYSWPVSILKDIEKWIRNFIWSGDTTTRKLVTVAWKKMCKPYLEGGLGLRSIISLNEAYNLKLCWDMMQSNEDWAKILKCRAIKGNKAIRYHISSSIWSSIKAEFPKVIENSYWLLGNGKDINFWKDAWCGIPIQELLQVTNIDIQHFPVFVNEYINNYQWSIPQDIISNYPEVRSMVLQVVIPFEESEDRLVWKHSQNGVLRLCDSYTFLNQPSATHHWARNIWSRDIPPSKSLLTWRVVHDKLPTDEKLIQRGCNIPSMCSLCYSCAETSFHLFFECRFAFRIWCWFASILDSTLHFQTIEDIWTICDRGWSPQCKTVIQASIVNIFSIIWFSRNQCRFQDIKPNWQQAINSIKSAVNLSGNNTSNNSNSSVKDLITLKKFDVTLHPPKPMNIKEIIWSPPYTGWIKCNTDGAATSITSSCGGIFRDSNANFLTCFTENLGGCSAYHAELSAIMRATEIAFHRSWSNLWIESDSSLVVMAFKNDSMIPCNIRNRWKNCVRMLYQMNFLVTHIYREGNRCADLVASKGLEVQGVKIWLDLPEFLSSFVIHDRLGMPNFRISHA